MPRGSLDGGFMPCWSGDGREPLFVNPDRKFVAAAVSVVPRFRVPRPVRILEAAPEIYGYLRFPGSDRFLALVDAKGEPLPPTRVVLNWQAVVKRR